MPARHQDSYRARAPAAARKCSNNNIDFNNVEQNVNGVEIVNNLNCDGFFYDEADVYFCSDSDRAIAQAASLLIASQSGVPPEKARALLALAPGAQLLRLLAANGACVYIAYITDSPEAHARIPAGSRVYVDEQDRAFISPP